MLWGEDLSLFSPQAIGERQNRGLLLQFLLSETIEAHKSVLAGKAETVITSHPRFFPYDWNTTTGHLNKSQEHSLFLKKSFPDKIKVVNSFEKTLSRAVETLSKKKNVAKEQFEAALQKIYTALEPLIEICKEDENLLFFLLKNRPNIDTLTSKGHLYEFLFKIHPCGLEVLGEKMCDQYHQRGFFSLIPEFKLLLTDLIHA
jgi:hypothetical protein